MRKGQDRQITWLPPKQLQTAIRTQRSNCAGIEARVQAAPRQRWAEPGRRSRCCWAGLRIVAPGAPPSSATHLLFSPCHQSCGRFGWFPAPWCSVPGSQDQQEGLEAPGSSLPNWVLELLPHCLLLHYQKQILAFHFIWAFTTQQWICKMWQKLSTSSWGETKCEYLNKISWQSSLLKNSNVILSQWHYRGINKSAASNIWGPLIPEPVHLKVGKTLCISVMDQLKHSSTHFTYIHQW